MEVQIFVFSRDHVIKRSSDFEGGVSPTASYHSANFDGHRYCGSANTRVYICYVSQWSKGRITWWMLSPTLSHHHFNFGGFRSYGKEGVTFPIPISIPILISMFANDQLLAWTKLRLSHAPFLKWHKIKTRFQFSSLHFVDHIFNCYLVE